MNMESYIKSESKATHKLSLTHLQKRQLNHYSNTIALHYELHLPLPKTGR